MHRPLRLSKYSLHPSATYKKIGPLPGLNEAAMILSPASDQKLGYFASKTPDPLAMAPNPYPSPIEDEEAFIPNTEEFLFLLVDDNAINLRIFSRVLQKLFPNAHIRTIQDSASLHWSAENLLHYHIIFLDIEMPIVTGTQIATKVRSTPALDHVGLFAVTTRFLQGDMELYDQLGFDFTFPKPIDFSYGYMLDRIERVLTTRCDVRT